MPYFRLRTWVLIILLVVVAVAFVLFLLVHSTTKGGGKGTPVPVSQHVRATPESLPNPASA